MASCCFWVSRDSCWKGQRLGSFEILFICTDRLISCSVTETLARVIDCNIYMWPLVWSGFPYKHGELGSRGEMREGEREKGVERIGGNHVNFTDLKAI